MEAFAANSATSVAMLPAVEATDVPVLGCVVCVALQASWSATWYACTQCAREYCLPAVPSAGHLPTFILHASNTCLLCTQHGLHAIQIPGLLTWHPTRYIAWCSNLLQAFEQAASLPDAHLPAR